MASNGLARNQSFKDITEESELRRYLNLLENTLRSLQTTVDGQSKEIASLRRENKNLAAKVERLNV